MGDLKVSRPCITRLLLAAAASLVGCGSPRIDDVSIVDTNGSMGVAFFALLDYPPITSNACIALEGTGQSNFEGTGGVPALSTTQPYNNKEIATDLLSLVPLIEGDSPANAETAASSLGNTLHEVDPLGRQVGGVIVTTPLPP